MLRSFRRWSRGGIEELEKDETTDGRPVASLPHKRAYCRRVAIAKSGQSKARYMRTKRRPMRSGQGELRKIKDQQLWIKLPRTAGNASAGVQAHLALSSGKCE
jgi:hypothetical protein